MEKVSVIIPYYNNENTILRALDSVKEQTYKNLEVIIINDGSYDKSCEKVKKWIESGKINVIHLKQENKGPSAARNLGIKASTGDFIALLDADDSWKKEKIEKQISILVENKDIVILGTDNEINYKGKLITNSINKTKIEEVTFEKRLLKNYFCTPSIIFRKSAIIKSQLYFDENQSYAEDTLLYLKILRKYRGAKITEPLVTLYKPELSKEGLSSNIVKTEMFELINYWKLYRENYLNEKKISILKLLFLWIFSLIKFLRRIIIIKFWR